MPRPDFIAKNQSPSTQSVDIFLPYISSFSSVEADKVWCPVRALKWYLDRTKVKRSSSSLFVSSIEPFKAISKASIARWLVECISMAGPEALVSGKFRAHDTRSVSSSWAFFNGASLKDIQQANFWSSPNTFISCYLKDVLAAEASLPLRSSKRLPRVLKALMMSPEFLRSPSKFSFFFSFFLRPFPFSFLLHQHFKGKRGKALSCLKL